MTDIIEEIEGRVCKACKKLKPLEEFKKGKTYRGGYRPQCIICCNIYSLKSFHKNKYKRPYIYEEDKDRKLQRTYGISYKEYLTMLEAQDGRCAICGTDDSGKRAFSVDHCHDTGEIRGLLCGNCNSGIGNLRDSISLLERAIEYLT